MASRKAPWLRIILIQGAFLLFIPLSQAQYNYNPNCQQAYEAILSLRFSEAQRLISIEKKLRPDNLIPVYLDNYIDFLTLIIGEERTVYNTLKERKGDRVDALENGRNDSPYYNFCLGEVHLQWAIARLKFGDYATAAYEVHKANACFSSNESRYPLFLINKVGMGVVHVIVSLIPENYKWVSALVGLDGSLEQGLSEIRQVTEYAGPDRITRMYKPQASFFLAFLTLNLQKNKRDAMTMLEADKHPVPGEQPLKSPLLIFARASILMKNGYNDRALAVLQERTSLQETFHFYYLDYLEGMARLNKLDYSASDCFKRFIAGFRGQNYLCSANQKLAWISLLSGDTVNYHRMIRRVLARGGSFVVDEDKQAAREAAYDGLPNVALLRSRLLFDGGYYSLAVNELVNNPVHASVQSKRDLVEYTYRLGRIYHETGNFGKAIDNYQKTILTGKTEPYYFAAGAAYQMGLLYENQGDYYKAASAYRQCLSINTAEYKASLHQKAKAGLNRLKKVKPKI